MVSEAPDDVVAHRPDRCTGCGTPSSAALPADVVSVHERVDLLEVAPVVTQRRRLMVRCPCCGLRVAAPVPAEACGTPFGPRPHAMALVLKTFQALSYERLRGALRDLFGLTLTQGGLMNLLRRGQHHFEGGRETAISALRRAAIVAFDETGVRIEGSNATHWVSSREAGSFFGRQANVGSWRAVEDQNRPAPASSVTRRAVQRLGGLQWDGRPRIRSQPTRLSV